MLELPQPKAEVIDDYVKLIVNEINGLLKKFHSTNPLRNLFTQANIDEILRAKPADMMAINTKMMGKLIPGYDDRTFEKQFYIKAQKKKSSVDKDFLLKNKHYDTIKDISEVLNYKKIVSENKKISFFLASKLSRNTCTYCNRLYTNTVTALKADRRYKSIAEPIIVPIARAQFDHWFSKNRYPLLALSYFNLIPSCSICNQIKSNKNFQLKTHFHPYETLHNESFNFNYRHKDLKIVNVTIDGATSKMAQNFRDLNIQEVYDVHSPLELRDLLELRYKYSENYIKKLLDSTFPGLPLSRSEAKRLIFGVEHEIDDYHKRPFSKFKNDILNILEK
ncbi:hypothetical protein [Pedobacter endophyticus]|uniref:HNH endonuclease n=1 Tax=Pedobacter endophyticus TaxID=2789740 RepID=A0A7U3Q3I9_9SPHI|nr:hypothetical protein [Pedobacter endophyticus]QPH37858.1 hypothetical protein IZT61_12125 [Pedobacter endophyticus]